MRLKITAKLLLGFALVLIMTAGVCTLLVKTMRDIDNAYSSLIDKQTYAYIYTQAAVGAYNKAALGLKLCAMTGNTESLTTYMAASNEGDAQLEKVAPLIEDNEESKKLYQGVLDRTKQLKDFGDQIIAMVKKASELTGDEQKEAYTELATFYATNEQTVTSITTSAYVPGRSVEGVYAGKQK